MHADSIDFGINKDTGKPVSTTFVAARALTRLTAYEAIWSTFDSDVELLGGLTNQLDDADAPF